MNNARRKWLADIYEAIENAKNEIENIREEEQESYDNIPENLQESERANTIYENIDNLDYIVSSLEDALGYFDDIQ